MTKLPNSAFTQFINSDSFPMFKTIIKELQKDIFDKMISPSTDKDELFLLQKKYLILDGLEDTIREYAKDSKGDI